MKVCRYRLIAGAADVESVAPFFISARRLSEKAVACSNALSGTSSLRSS